MKVNIKYSTQINLQNGIRSLKDVHKVLRKIPIIENKLCLAFKLSQIEKSSFSMLATILEYT